MTTGLLILFEDNAAGFFEPVALTRSVASLRSGAWTHRERWERLFPERQIGTVVRGYLAEIERASGAWEFVNSAPDAEALFVAAAAGRQDDNLRAIRELPAGSALLAGGVLLAFRTAAADTPRAVAALREWVGDAPFPVGVPAGDGDGDGERFARAQRLQVLDAKGTVPRTLVELMVENAAAITADFSGYESLLPQPNSAEYAGAHFVRPDRIRLAEWVSLAPGVVLDASEGPILIGPGTRVQANAVIMGPVAIGADCVVKPLARVMDGVSLGPVCRIGGEVDATIVQSYSNKQHDGFLGHSYLGSWVNLGAATDTSDLKNNYGPVTVSIAGHDIVTGTRGVGSLIGDHSKTGIHTMLNTGTVIGVSCNLFGVGLPPRTVPSFSWGGDGQWQEYRLEKALQVAGIVTSRRQVELGAADEAVLQRIHEATAAARGPLATVVAP